MKIVSKRFVGVIWVLWWLPAIGLAITLPSKLLFAQMVLWVFYGILIAVCRYKSRPAGEAMDIKTKALSILALAQSRPEDGRCIHCGAGNSAHHSYTCPTGLHPDRRDEQSRPAGEEK
jgi:hypothetical protein